MMKIVRLWMVASVLCGVAVACGSTSGGISEPQTAVGEIRLAGGLATLDVCRAIPLENLEAVLGGKVSGVPERIESWEGQEASGCAYEAGKDSGGNALFGYVVFVPRSVYDSQPQVDFAAVDGLGQAAYFTNGADARQLWVQVNAEVAFVVGLGDRPNEAGAQALARLVLEGVR